MWHAIWIGFCQGLGFCIAIALAIQFDEFAKLAKKVFYSRIIPYFDLQRDNRSTQTETATVPTPVPTTPAPVATSVVPSPVAPSADPNEAKGI